MSTNTTEQPARSRVECVWDPHLKGDIRGLVVRDPATCAWFSMDGNLMVTEVALTYSTRFAAYHVDDTHRFGDVIWAQSDRGVLHATVGEALEAAHKAWDIRWA